VINHPYAGRGTDDDPFVVVWIPGDSRNPMNFSSILKWSLTILVSLTTLTIALISSAYSGGMAQVMKELGSSREVTTLGISLFVLGFAFGPLIWAPMSEVFGRRNVFTITFCLLTAFNAGCAGSENIQTLIILRFLAGFFGSSPFGNAGGSIADMFPAAKRGIAISLFSAAPLCGPAIGPIIGGFLGSGAGWRWVEGFLAIFSGVIWICLCVFLPETYAPVLLRRRAEKLSELSGKVYRSKLDIERGKLSLQQTLTTALSRPWRLLFREPIVFLFCIYMAIIYGILYLCFAAFPIVFQEARGWNEGIGGLAFLGILVGMIIGVIYTFPENMHYAKLCRQTTGRLPPEVRLPPSIVGAIALPIGLFWFAWTNSPSIHWMASIAAGAPFGFGLVLVFLSVFNYLIDAYTIYSASVLAANSALRSLFGAAFPLFTSYLYSGLGKSRDTTLRSTSLLTTTQVSIGRHRFLRSWHWPASRYPLYFIYTVRASGSAAPTPPRPTHSCSVLHRAISRKFGVKSLSSRSPMLRWKLLLLTWKAIVRLPACLVFPLRLI
jgi:multidrug resistance protein